MSAGTHCIDCNLPKSRNQEKGRSCYLLCLLGCIQCLFVDVKAHAAAYAVIIKLRKCITCRVYLMFWCNCSCMVRTLQSKDSLRVCLSTQVVGVSSVPNTPIPSIATYKNVSFDMQQIIISLLYLEVVSQSTERNKVRLITDPSSLDEKGNAFEIALQYHSCTTHIQVQKEICVPRRLRVVLIRLREL